MNRRRQKESRRSRHDAARPESGPNVVSGRKPAQELLLHAPERVLEIFLNAELSPGSLPADLNKCLDAYRGALKRIPRDKLDLLAPGNNQGIALHVAPRQEATLKAIVARARARPGEVILVLDEVSDPQNLGSILRAAEAFSVSGVILTRHRSASLTAAVVRVSAGASELLNICTVGNLQRAIEEMKKAGIWVVGASIGETARPAFDLELAFPLALVLGSEGEGLRALTKKLCDELVEIPLSGKMQSLNVNQAASILLYEAGRQRAFQQK